MVGGRGSYRGFTSRHREPKVRSDGRQLTFNRKEGGTRSEELGAGELDSGDQLVFDTSYLAATGFSIDFRIVTPRQYLHQA